MGCHSSDQRGWRGREAGLKAPWGPSQRPHGLVATLAARGSRDARKMSASCEVLISLLLPLPGDDWWEQVFLFSGTIIWKVRAGPSMDVSAALHVCCEECLCGCACVSALLCRIASLCVVSS